jgi:hypothetical protein
MMSAVSSPRTLAYDEPGVLTAIAPELVASVAHLPADAVDLCRAAQGLVIPPELASALGVPEERLTEKSIRRVTDLLQTILGLSAASLREPRSPTDRAVGTCRHFSVLSCAFLRFHGIGARARCGFATYFEAGKFLDHWITEYWHPDAKRWVRVDSEVLGLPFVARPEDLSRDEFLTGGEAWKLCRQGRVDPSLFGVSGAPHAWGIAEVRGNAIRDLAALNKVEMLPWDEWGRMHASYDGETGTDFDELVDAIATVCESNDLVAIGELYASEDLAVPGELIV